MADPVSWLLIEPGWQVVGANGEEIGKVDRVEGDKEADIFDGLETTSGYVASERVGQIFEGTVHLTS